MNDDSEREDGEIVDDEDNIFEEVSDCSIPSAFNSGKSPAYQDNISIVSLSSISDNEETISKLKRCRHHSTNRRKRKSSYSRRQHNNNNNNNNKHYKQYKEDSDSTSEDDRLNRTVLRQLKEAVRIDKQSMNNNLESRLKQMLKGNDKEYGSDSYSGNNDEDAELEKLRSDALNTKNNKESIITNGGTNNINQINDKNVGLEIHINKKLNLNESVDDNELVELRLAALKSAVIQKHMQRKKRKEEEKQESSIPEIIVIDDTNKENTNLDSMEVVENITTQTDFKESANQQNNVDVTEKIAESLKENLNTTAEEDVDIMRAKLLASMSKKITSVNSQTNNKPPAIPQKTTITNIYKPSNIIKPNTVNNAKGNNILKVPTVNIKPLVININGESESDSSDIEFMEQKKPINDEAIALRVTEFLKKTRAEAEANKPEINGKINASTSDVSDSILAEKSVVKLLPKSQQQEYRMLKQKLLNAKRKRVRKPSLKQGNNSNSNKIVQNHNNNQQEKKPLGEELPILTNERNVPAQVADRLQMKGKYKELEPLLQKVNQASILKKNTELQIKRLLDELKQSRKSLVDSQTIFTKLVKELILKKETIDKRPSKFKQTASKTQQLPSSTPLKEMKEKDIQETTQKQEVIEEVQSEENQIKNDIVENNDESKNENFSEYISPLGSTTRNIIADPLGTFCPYEIFGVCKDAECTYKHYS